MKDERRPAKNARRLITSSDFSAGVRESHGLEPVATVIPEALVAWANSTHSDLTAQRLRLLYRETQEREARAA